MSYTPFNAPLLSGLFGDREIAAFFSVKADLEAMLRFEIELARAEAAAGVIPAQAADHIANALADFSPDLVKLSKATAIDGMAVPEFVRQLRDAVGAPFECHVHFGATSQDAIDTSLILRLQDANEIILRRLGDVVAQLDLLAKRFGARHLMARTRMQAALPVTVVDRINLWRRPVLAHLQRHVELAPRLCKLQFGGPVGTLEKLGDHGSAVRKGLAQSLGLTDPGASWHTDRSSLVAYASWLSLITGSLGKIGLDFTLMAQNEMAEVTYEGSGGSSAMAHKKNPVKAEALVTIARFTATLAAGMNHTMLHEQERSGSAWCLEWMLLPQLAVATGAALLNAESLLLSITSLGQPPKD